MDCLDTALALYQSSLKESSSDTHTQESDATTTDIDVDMDSNEIPTNNNKDNNKPTADSVKGITA